MIKYGLKIWSTDKQRFSEVVEIIKSGQADFVEIYLAPNSFVMADFKIFKENNIPVNLHAPHTLHNFDVFALNEKSLAIWQEQVIKTADFLNAQFIITHAGVGEDKEIFRRESVKLKDYRVLIENMPYKGFISLGGVFCFGYTKEQLNFVHKECGFEICFDVCHAVASAASQKINPYDFIGDLIKILEPSYFHLAGGFVGDEIDKHLDIWEGDFDFAWLKKELALLASPPDSGDVYLVFETPKIGKGLENDVRNIEYFKGLSVDETN